MDEARRYYAKEFADVGRKRPTPCMEKLHFLPGNATADPDEAVLSDEELQRASDEGQQ